MKKKLIELTILIALCMFGGALVVASGIMPINASSGHWPVTVWFLNFAKDRSVAMHAAAIEVPPLDEPSLVMLGAGAYQSNCQWCHGSPAERHPVVAARMQPPPPYLPAILDKWESQELFYIVKHGIKLTGMPAWPAQHRDDEVWAVVAFLRAFADMEADEYDQLVHIQAEPVDDSAARLAITKCAPCHGIQGNGRAGKRVPKLSGQQTEYLHASLNAFAADQRHSGIMQPIASRLSPSEIASLSKYYASFDSPFNKESVSVQKTDKSTSEEADAENSSFFEEADAESSGHDLFALFAAQQLVMKGHREAKIPSCVDCHGPGEDSLNTAYPRLAGQHAEYLVTQMRLFSSRNRGGSKHASLMHPIADKLSESQRQQIATYYESLENAKNEN